MEVPSNRKHHHKWQMAKAPNQVLRPLRNDIGSSDCNQDSTPAIEGCKYQKVVVRDGLVDIQIKSYFVPSLSKTLAGGTTTATEIPVVESGAIYR